MSRQEPRIQIDPTLHKVIVAAAAARKMSKRDFVEYAVRLTMFQFEATKQLVGLVQASTSHVPELFEKIDAISTFIADRYALDLARENNGEV
jgi:hypothetical protein